MGHLLLNVLEEAGNSELNFVFSLAKVSFQLNLWDFLFNTSLFLFSIPILVVSPNLRVFKPVTIHVHYINILPEMCPDGSWMFLKIFCLVRVASG